MPGPVVDWQVGVGVGDGLVLGAGEGVGVTGPRVLTCPATMVACPRTPPLTRVESVVTRYVPVGTSTNPNHPEPSVVALRKTTPDDASARRTAMPPRGVPSVPTATP